MKEAVLQSLTATENEEERAAARNRKRLDGWKLTFIFCASVGVACALSGLILGALSYLVYFKDPGVVNQIGNFMIVAAFPLMMLGAHALDKMSEIKRQKNKFEP